MITVKNKIKQEVSKRTKKVNTNQAKGTREVDIWLLSQNVAWVKKADVIKLIVEHIFSLVGNQNNIVIYFKLEDSPSWNFNTLVFIRFALNYTKSFFSNNQILNQNKNHLSVFIK